MSGYRPKSRQSGSGPRGAADRGGPRRPQGQRSGPRAAGESEFGDSGPERSVGPRPPLRLFTNTLWEYPSQHYDQWVDQAGVVHRYGAGLARQAASQGAGQPASVPRSPVLSMQGDQSYVGATPSWVIWQLLQRYTRADDLVVDPMCGSGTTIDVARDIGRRALGYDLAPTRPDIFRADARRIPLEDGKADFVFIDPPYSTHVDYSDDPRCIGKLSAGGDDGGKSYYQAMGEVFHQAHRVLRDRRYMAVYVSDSFKKNAGDKSRFMPIGFELFAMLRTLMKPVDIIAVVRHNQKLKRGNWNRAAEEGNFFLRGFNYLLIFKKEQAEIARPLPARAPSTR